MKEQILKLHGRGIGKKKIAQMLGLSKNTVKGIIRAAETGPHGLNESPTWARGVAWDVVAKELGGRYATIKCLHAEYAPDGVGYLRFWRELQRRIPESNEDRARIRFQYKPGTRVEVDYCDGIPITDPKTGSQTPTHLFCAVSACSSYAFGEFVMTQRREEFIASQDRMHHFFGGVFEYLVVDNLKSGVHKAHLYDPDVNPVYVDYANHMNFGVMPARPSTPRDKPTIETTIGVIQRQFFAEVRNRTFYSLNELNTAFREYLTRLNAEVMKDYGVSRNARFAEERALLRPLPAHPFEVAEYRTAKVHPDCHVQVDKNFYSVPFPLIGQALRVRVTPRLIEIFNVDHDAVAVHSRLKGRGLFSTIEAHYPEGKLAAARFDVVVARREAARIGPETQRFVESLLESPHPLRYLRRVQGVLRLRKSCSATAMEYACHQALLFNRPRLAFVADCVKQFDLYGHRPRLIGAPERDLSSVYIKPPVHENEENDLL